MFLLGPVLALSAIGFLCWLMFTLAVFALPAFIGVTIGIWSFHTGASALGAIIVGLVAAGATFGIGQLLLLVVPWTWARLLIIAVYTAPSAVAGDAAIHGIAQMAMSSPVWQTVFSVIGAVAVGHHRPGTNQRHESTARTAGQGITGASSATLEAPLEAGPATPYQPSVTLITGMATRRAVGGPPRSPGKGNPIDESP